MRLLASCDRRDNFLYKCRAEWWLTSRLPRLVPLADNDKVQAGYYEAVIQVVAS